MYPRTSLFSVIAVVALGSALQADDQLPALVVPQANEGAFTLNLDALDDDTEMSAAEKGMVFNALVASPGFQPDAISVAGLTGDCKVKKTVGIPTGADCKLSATPAATKTLAGLGTAALTGAICLVVDAEDFEVTAPICFGVLYPIAKSTLQPALESCSNAGESTELDLDFKIVPPKVSPGAHCT